MIGLDHTGVCGYEVTRREAYHIAWNNLGVWLLGPFAVSQD